jgi:hypothetical protein
MTPEIAIYWGEYAIAYRYFEMDPPDRDCPLQYWYAHSGNPPIAPSKKETAYIHLGNFSFGPYKPGLTLSNTRCGGKSTITLTGDLWANLSWPHVMWDYLLSTDSGAWIGWMSPYPQYSMEYKLYVDGEEMTWGYLPRQQPNLSSFGFFWDNLAHSWNTTGHTASIALELRSMATISTLSYYEIEFDLTKNQTIQPFLTGLRMPLNYSAGESMIVNPQLRNGTSITTMSYSYDLCGGYDYSMSWEKADSINNDFIIPCTGSRWISIRINATDLEGNKYVYSTVPAAICRDLTINILRIDPTRVSVKLADVSGYPVKAMAIQSTVDGVVSYAMTDSNGTTLMTKKSNTSEITLKFLGAGLYGPETLTLNKPKGEVTGNDKVDVLDLISISTSLGSTPGTPKWNGNTDLNSDGRINVLDLIMCAKDLGKNWA